MNHSSTYNNVLEYGNEATDCLLSTHSILELMNVKQKAQSLLQRSHPYIKTDMANSKSILIKEYLKREK